MGKKAEEWSVLTNDNTTYKFTVKHPASAAYSGSKWDSDNIFMRTRAIVKKMSGKTINW